MWVNKVASGDYHSTDLWEIFKNQFETYRSQQKINK